MKEDDAAIAVIRCLCGRKFHLKRGESKTCACGVGMEIVPMPGKWGRPWATVPDGRKCKGYAPRIVSWEWEGGEG